MTQSEFTLWLHGYVEIAGARPDERQWEIIKDHLALVFNKVTPDRSPVVKSITLPSGEYVTGAQPVPYCGIGSDRFPFISTTDQTRVAGLITHTITC